MQDQDEVMIGGTTEGRDQRWGTRNYLKQPVLHVTSRVKYHFAHQATSQCTVVNALQKQMQRTIVALGGEVNLAEMTFAETHAHNVLSVHRIKKMHVQHEILQVKT
jgi:hypothetical protein